MARASHGRSRILFDAVARLQRGDPDERDAAIARGEVGWTHRDELWRRAAFPSLAREAEVSTDTARALGACAQEAEAYLHAARRLVPLPRRSFTGSNLGRELAASAARIRRNAAESDGRREARRKP